MSNVPARARRGAFTLIEILVVIAIIAVLVAIGAGAYIRVMSAQQEARTEDSLRIIHKFLGDNWNDVKTKAEKEDINAFPALLSLASNDPARAGVLLKIFRITEAFPQNYAEIQFPFLPASGATAAIQNATIYGTSAQPAVLGQPWIPADRRYVLATLNVKLVNMKAASLPTTQSAACLFLTLTQINRGGNLKMSEDKLPTNIRDTDGDGINEFIDNYGTAIVFVRFPIGTNNNGFDASVLGGGTFAAPYGPIPGIVATELANLPNGAKPNFGDPLDPDGLLQQTVPNNNPNFPKLKVIPWYNAAYVTQPAVITNGQVLAALCGHPIPVPNPKTGQPAPQPYYVPFVTSLGADKTYGPNPPGSESMDDVLSFRLKIGARGD
jgi:prepilin-type N-terminal cleavage/methylation domain-containing protein